MTSIFNHPYCKPFIRHPFKSIKCFFVSLKWAYQRVKKGYCDKDLLFGVKNWFLEMLPEVIDEIKEKTGTVPLSIHEEAIKSFGLNPVEYWAHCDSDLHKEYYERVEAETDRRWRDILTRISFLLRESVEWKCSKQNPCAERYRKVKLDDPEYEDVHTRYYEEENKLDAYRKECQREAVELLLKWSGDLEI